LKILQNNAPIIVGRSPPNIDGELEPSFSKKHGTISMRMMINPNAIINSQVSMVSSELQTKLETKL
jgi:hypothetical protein